MYACPLTCTGVAVNGATEDASVVFFGTFDKGVMMADATGACTPSFPVSDKIVDLAFDPDSCWSTAFPFCVCMCVYVANNNKKKKKMVLHSRSDQRRPY